MNTPQLDIFATLKAYVQTRQPVRCDVRPGLHPLSTESVRSSTLTWFLTVFYPLTYSFPCCFHLLSHYLQSKSFARMLRVGEDLTTWCNSNRSLFYGPPGCMGWVLLLASREYFTDIIKSVTFLFPKVLPLPHVSKGLLCQFRFGYHQSHISHMHIDRLRHLVKENRVFTIFVVLPSGPTIPLHKNFI